MLEIIIFKIAIQMPRSSDASTFFISNATIVALGLNVQHLERGLILNLYMDNSFRVIQHIMEKKIISFIERIRYLKNRFSIMCLSYN